MIYQQLENGVRILITEQNYVKLVKMGNVLFHKFLYKIQIFFEFFQYFGEEKRRMKRERGKGSGQPTVVSLSRFPSKTDYFTMR